MHRGRFKAESPCVARLTSSRGRRLGVAQRVVGLEEGGRLAGQDGAADEQDVSRAWPEDGLVGRATPQEERTEAITMISPTWGRTRPQTTSPLTKIGSPRRIERLKASAAP